ncbi:MAG: trimethylamine methyltransferase family protein [Promethearchaeota archaeon]
MVKSKKKSSIEVNKNTIALDEIESVILGEKNSLYFLGLKHTAKNIEKELFIPSISERRSRNTWIKKGALNIVDKAQKRVKQILKDHKPFLLDPELEKKIDDYTEQVEIRNINEYIN